MHKALSLKLHGPTIRFAHRGVIKYKPGSWTGSSPAWWLHGWLLQPAQVPTFSSSSHATEVGMALSCVLTREKVEQSSNRGTAYIVSIGIYSTREISSAPHRHPGAKPCAVLLCYYGIRDVCIMYYTVLK